MLVGGASRPACSVLSLLWDSRHWSVPWDFLITWAREKLPTLGCWEDWSQISSVIAAVNGIARYLRGVLHAVHVPVCPAAKPLLGARLDKVCTLHPLTGQAAWQCPGHTVVSHPAKTTEMLFSPGPLPCC